MVLVNLRITFAAADLIFTVFEGHGLSGGVEPRPVGEAIPGHRIKTTKVKHIAAIHPGRRQEIIKDVGQGDERRAGIESKAVSLEDSELAADGVCLLAHDHPFPAGREPSGNCQPTHAGADDHNVSSVAT